MAQTAHNLHEIDLKVAAELLNISHHKLTRILREHGVLIYSPHGTQEHLIATPTMVQSGYFVNKLRSWLKPINGHSHKVEYYEQACVTEQGMNYIRKILIEMELQP